MVAFTDLACPSCGTATWGQREIGQAGLCLQCRALIILDFDLDPDGDHRNADGSLNSLGYTPRLKLRRPTDTEELALLRNARVQEWIRKLDAYHKMHGPPMSHPPDDGR
jgi:hypothetical protein